MKILKSSDKAIKQVVRILKQGGTVVYPSDTAYALGGDPDSSRAVSTIYKIKKRKRTKALPFIVASYAMAAKYFTLGYYEKKLAKRYWPGPLSLILDFKLQIAEGRRIAKNLKSKNVAVRVPKSRVARKLAHQLGRPIISTSANISGAGECYSVKDAYKQFYDKKYTPDVILDSGRLRKRKPSTIVKIIDGQVVVLRQGPTKLEL